MAAARRLRFGDHPQTHDSRARPAMSDDRRIGRVLVASLHQAIAEILPIGWSSTRTGSTCRACARGRLAWRRCRRCSASSGARARRTIRSRRAPANTRPIGRSPACRRSSGASFGAADAAAHRAALFGRRGRSCAPPIPGRARCQAEARHGLRRSSRVAVLRGAGDVAAAALRLLCGGDRPRAPSFSPCRPTLRSRVPRANGARAAG